MQFSTTNNSDDRWLRKDINKALQSLERYKKIVFFSKTGLIALSFLLLLTIIILPIVSSDKEGLRLVFSNNKNNSVVSAEKPIMQNPRFQGVDAKNQPYLVTADSAIQDDETTVILENMQADLYTQDESWLNVTANDGTLNSKDKILTLKNDIVLYHDKGYQFNIAEISIDMNSKIARSKSQLTGNGPMGAVKADEFVWDTINETMSFVKPVLTLKSLESRE